MAKSNDYEVERRVNVVVEMLLAGLSRADIIQNITNSDLNWKTVTVRTIDNYIKKAYDVLYKPLEDDRTKIKNKLHSQYMYLYKKMVNSGDYQGANKVLKNVSALTGSNEAIKTDNKTELSGKLQVEQITGMEITD